MAIAVRPALLGVVLIGLITIALARAQGVDFRVEPRAQSLPAFRLTAQTGDTFGRDDLKDHWSLVFLGYTYCPDVCPMTLYELDGVIGSFAERYPAMPEPRIVFLAVDPERDREIMAGYVESFRDSTVAITGEREQIDQLVGALDGFYKFDPKNDDGNYTVQHSATVNIVDPDGRIVARMNPPFDFDTTADHILDLMRGS